MEDSRRRQQQQGLQNQAEQRVNYEALQQATRQAQQKAIDTGKPQTVTQDDIGIQRTSILNTKYLASTTPATDTTPEVKTYAVPVVDPKSQQDALRSNYADFQKATLNAQNRSILAENYDNFKVNQIVQNPGQATAYGRANVRYSVGLEDSISGPKQYYLADPTNPFAISDKPPEQQSIQRQIAPPKYQSTGNAFVDFGFGVRNYFENIPKGAQKGVEEVVLGKKSDVKIQPEAEGEFVGVFTNAGKSLIEGKPMTVGQDLESLGKRASENPAYYAGSAYGSAVFNIFTFGAGSAVAKGGRGIFEFGSKLVGKGANVERDIIKPLSSAAEKQGGTIGIDASDKIISLGTEGDPFRVSVIRPAVLNKQPAREVFASSPLEAPKTPGTTNTDLIFGKPERTTQYVQSFVKINDKEIPVSALRKEPVNATGAQKAISGFDTGLKADTRSPLVKGTNIFDVEQGARGENLFIKAKPYDKVVATSETVTDKEFANFLKVPGNAKKVLGTGKTDDIFRLEAGAGNAGPKTPFNFEAPKAPQVTESLVKSLPSSAEPLATGSGNAGMFAGAVNAGKTLGLSKQVDSNRGFSLGLGGVTGAERKRASSTASSDESGIFGSLATPASAKSQAKDLIGSFRQPSSRQSTKASIFTLQSESLGVKQDTNPLAGLRITPQTQNKQDTTSLFRTGSIFDVGSATGQKTEPFTFSATKLFQTTRTRPDDIVKIDIPDKPKPTRTPNTPLLTFPYELEPEKKRKGKKGKKLRQSRKTFKANDLLSIELPSLGKALKGFKIE